LTKGQYSPTSEPGTVTKSTPLGSIDHPFNPVSLALGAEATFVARTVDADRQHLTSVLRAAAAHRGSSFVEIYQNCPIYNDDAFEVLKDHETKDEALIQLTHGEPIRFGTPGEDGLGSRGLVRSPSGGVEAVRVADVSAEELLVHDAQNPDPSQAFAISRLVDSELPLTPVGVFRQVTRPTYDDLARQQVDTAAAQVDDRMAALAALVAGRDTWTVD
jgi:2-oxoglutarate ferredoxin oxidoreductase subunit beta